MTVAGIKQVPLIPFVIEADTGPIVDLENILAMQSAASKTNRIFKILQETRGIALGNYLPWSDTFSVQTIPGGRKHISRINPSNLNRPVMWGIDPTGRPFIAFKYLFRKFRQKTATLKPESFVLFQSIPKTGLIVQKGGSSTILNLDPHDHGEAFFDNLKKFLGGTTFKQRHDDKDCTCYLDKS